MGEAIDKMDPYIGGLVHKKRTISNSHKKDPYNIEISLHKKDPYSIGVFFCIMYIDTNPTSFNDAKGGRGLVP